MEFLQIVTNDTLENVIVDVERFADGTCMIESSTGSTHYDNIDQLISILGGPIKYKYREVN